MSHVGPILRISWRSIHGSTWCPGLSESVHTWVTATKPNSLLFRVPFPIFYNSQNNGFSLNITYMFTSITTTQLRWHSINTKESNLGILANKNVLFIITTCAHWVLTWSASLLSDKLGHSQESSSDVHFNDGACDGRFQTIDVQVFCSCAKRATKHTTL